MGSTKHYVKGKERFEAYVPSQRQPDAGPAVVQRRRADSGGPTADSVQKVK